MTTFCLFCDAESVTRRKGASGRQIPLCDTCRQAYESGNTVGYAQGLHEASSQVRKALKQAGA